MPLFDYLSQAAPQGPRIHPIFHLQAVTSNKTNSLQLNNPQNNQKKRQKQPLNKQRAPYERAWRQLSAHLGVNA